MTKFGKLKLKIEDLETEHEEILTKLKKDYEKKELLAAEELNQVKEEYTNFKLKAKITGGMLMLIIISLIIFFVRIYQIYKAF